MHEVTKHTPYELAFGQPPRSLLIPDPNVSGKIAEEDLENNCPEQDGDSENPDSGEGQGGDESPASGGGEGQDGDSQSPASGEDHAGWGQ